ncbi:MAG: arylesterase [Desulfobacterales bacterium]
MTHTLKKWKRAAVLLLTSCMLLISACEDASVSSSEAPEASATGSDGVIVAMGDSLTEGLGLDENQAYPARLEERLAAEGYDYSVINAGISGETSSGALSRVDWVLTLEPDIVILETGANDGLRGIDPSLTRTNIDTIVKRLVEEDVVVVLAGMKMFRNLGTAYVRDFEAVYPWVAERNDVILVPFFLEGVAARATLNQSDGIHPTSEGYAKVVEGIWPYVREAIQTHQAKGRG